MDRRSFISTTAMVAAGVALAACSATSTPSTPNQIGQQVLTDVGTVANGLANILPALSTINNIPAATITTLTSAAQAAQKAAADLTATMQANVAQPIISQVQAAVTTFSTDLAGFTSNPTVQQILSDIELVMPLILTAVELVPALAAKAASPADIAAARQRLSALPQVKA